jgi:hypothetical protein
VVTECLFGFRDLLPNVVICRFGTRWNLVHVILGSFFAVSFLPFVANSVRLPLHKLPKSKLNKLLLVTQGASMVATVLYTALQPLSRVPFNNRSRYFGVASVHVRSRCTVSITKEFRAILIIKHHTNFGHGLFLLQIVSSCLFAFRIDVLASIGIGHRP